MTSPLFEALIALVQNNEHAESGGIHCQTRSQDMIKQYIRTEMGTLNVDQPLTSLLKDITQLIKKHGVGASASLEQQPHSDDYEVCIYAPVLETDYAFAERLKQAAQDTQWLEVQEREALSRLKAKYPDVK